MEAHGQRRCNAQVCAAGAGRYLSCDCVWRLKIVSPRKRPMDFAGGNAASTPSQWWESVAQVVQPPSWSRKRRTRTGDFAAELFRGVPQQAAFSSMGTCFTDRQFPFQPVQQPRPFSSPPTSSPPLSSRLPSSPVSWRRLFPVGPWPLLPPPTASSWRR